MTQHSIEELIADIRDGRMVILVDDEDRENEGDLVMAAACVRPADINFMATQGRGLICLPLSAERCQQLGLPLMVTHNRESHHTKFTVSIDAARGISTGISAADRALTVRTAVRPDAKPSDFVQPGHIFPLQAEPGGVLTRAGHTEAGCDLARLAGFEPAALIVEIMNEDGSMARRPELERFAETHGLRIGTIADLIHYRIVNERTVERQSSCRYPTEVGDFTLVSYVDRLANRTHFALVRGDILPTEPVLIRVHVADPLLDLTHGTRAGPRRSVLDALTRVVEEGTGIVLVLRHPPDEREIADRLRDFELEDEGQAPAHREANADLRTYGVGAQILLDLGVRRMRLLGSTRRIHGISGFGLEVVEYVS